MAGNVAPSAMAAPPAVAPPAVAPPAVAPAMPHVASRLAEGVSLTIVAFGSSSTEGIGASSPAAAYPTRLQVELARSLAAPMRVVVENRGIGGEDADTMLRRVPAIAAEKPDLVIWQTGTNDPLDDVPLSRFVAETRQGIAAFRAAGIDVMLMEPQLCARLDQMPGAMRFRGALRALGREQHVPVIRRYAMMQEWLARKMLTARQMLAPDGLHMADGGYRLLAMAVAGQILGRQAPRRLLALQ